MLKYRFVILLLGKIDMDDNKIKGLVYYLLWLVDMVFLILRGIGSEIIMKEGSRDVE